MAEHQDSQERTEQPTERRKQESRKKGQVPRSKELNTMLSLLATALGLMILGPSLVTEFAGLFEWALSFDREEAFDKSSVSIRFAALMQSTLLVLVPFFGVAVLGAFAGPLAMGGWSFSPSAMAFKLEKIDPFQGLKRLFSPKSLMELIKTLIKFFLLIGATMFLFYCYIDEILALTNQSWTTAFDESIGLLLWCLVILSSTLVFIVMFDVPFELWNHNRQLKMTLQEIRDEMKETDGRPEVKGKIRSMQREISQRRMMQDVPKADVVITNPTHFAVALKYDERPGAAPKVVAKGRDLVALNIRNVAEEHSVTVFSSPPLARALYGTTEIGQEIPQNLYLAVARVLAYVYQLNQSAYGEYVPPPEEISLPEEYQEQYGKGVNEHE
ncbi:flagellar biosynthesis protein FlhB [Porticoccus sp.]